MTRLPLYHELDTVGPSGERHNWGVFGDDDQLGTINFITPEVVASAAATVTMGATFNLSIPLDAPTGSLTRKRQPYEHHIERTRSGRDEWVDSFFPQGASQWDGLAHVRYREFGYYNGRSESDLDQGALGIDNISERGIVSRGLLVDAQGWVEATTGRPLDPTTRFPLGATELESILEWQHSEPADGDILLIHTGWMAWYGALGERQQAERRASLHPGPGGLETPGLDPSPGTAAWLWDHRLAAVASDTPALECLQVRADEGFLHRRLIALLGMPLGEFWWLHDLAVACRSAQRYHFLLSATPWRMPRGVGSPITPVAIL